jgi:hypothetical protein
LIHMILLTKYPNIIVSTSGSDMAEGYENLAALSGPRSL